MSFISIIIVNFNTKKLLQNCLDSIYENLKIKDFEIIVVDNNSSDGSVQMLDKDFPNVKIIRNKKNIGFGAANNLGVKKALGDQILLLNSDTVLKFPISNFQFSNNKEVVGFELLNPDGSIQPSAGYFPTLFRIFLQMFFIDDLPFVKKIIKPYQQNDLAFYKNKQDVDWVTGACILMPKKLFEQVDGFDEQIFMYGEEVDLCFRLKKNGSKIVFDPSVKIIHKKGASSPDGFLSSVVGEYKGLLTFYKKHFPDQLLQLKFILKIGALLRILLFAIISPSKVKAYKVAFAKI
jgi:GT2 family glycosyltransferase